MECVLQSKRSLLMQFFIMVTPVEVCNHDPEGSELHKQMPVWVVYGYLHKQYFAPAILLSLAVAGHAGSSGERF